MNSTWPETLSHRIDQVAKSQPSDVALKDDFCNSLTYSMMKDRVESIAESLLNCDVHPGRSVLVYQEASTDWICSMLAIERIGAVYVPLDVKNPLQRLAIVSQDCDPSAILVDKTTAVNVPDLSIPNAHVIDVFELGHKPSTHVPIQAKADFPAAILYTSGSTGTPKGIIVTQAGLRNEIEGYTKKWGLGAEITLQQSTFTFNHSMDQIYTGLVNGGTVYVVPYRQRGDPIEITKVIQEHAITYTKATPSEYLMWLEFGIESLREASAWRFAFGGGEPLTTTLTHAFADLGLRHLRFFNSYGPTEISISSHKMEIPYYKKAEVEALGRIPCGYSLPNYHTYIFSVNSSL